jgi:hypothetical protein
MSYGQLGIGHLPAPRSGGTGALGVTIIVTIILHIHNNDAYYKYICIKYLRLEVVELGP